MVKLSNRGKGKPSKRKTLKTKYKIVRKVAQHKKKVRKQMRKLGSKNIKPRKGDKSNTLPNSFPFKAQILQHFKNQQPTQQAAGTIQLQPAEWGLVALQNRNTYFPKDKDHLTKKYITIYDKIWSYANVIIQTVDARDPNICLNPKIHEQCTKRGIPLIVVVCKIDTVPEKHIAKVKKQLQGKYTYCLFTTDSKKRSSLLEQLLTKIKQSGDKNKCVVVVGKSNTGKHVLIKQFMKLAKFHNQDYATINDVKITEGVNMIDTPYKVEDQTKYPLFSPPSSLAEQSVGVQEQRIIKYLIDHLKNRNDFIMHYGIGQFISVDDLLKKVGKANRIFGKGGMVNVGAVRTSILTDWYHGKLNYIFAL